MSNRDHGDPGDGPTIPPPLTAPNNPAQPSAAEEARTVAASTNIATLASLSEHGDPWASFVTYGLLDGEPVLCVSNLAEHGRNLARDPRASLSIVTPDRPSDPLASNRITLAGVVERPEDGRLTAARDAHLAAVPAAKVYVEFSDFSLWVLRVQRVRWVGGYGRMDSADARAYLDAEPDPVVPAAAPAIAHLNADHADALAVMARAFGGYPDTESAQCVGADRYGLHLQVRTPRGVAHTRVGHAEPIDSIGRLRAATVDLTRRARRAEEG